MISFDFLFDSILRFYLLAFLSLGAGVVALYFFQQPVERIQLIKISLLSIILVAIFSHSNWKPSIKVPLLPAVDSPRHDEQVSPFDEESMSVAATLGQPEGFGHSTANVADVDTDLAHDSASAVAAIPWDLWAFIKKLVVFGFIGVSVFQTVYLLIGFGLTRRLIASATPLSDSIDKGLRQIFAEFSDHTDIHFLTTNRIQVPMVNGIIRPTILLPPQLAKDDADPLLLRKVSFN